MMKKVMNVAFLCAMGLMIGNSVYGQVGANLLLKKMQKDANTLDESMAVSAEIYVDGESTHVTTVPDGTNAIILRCPIPEGAKSLKKAAMQKEFLWRLELMVTGNNSSTEDIEFVFFDDRGKVTSWAEYIKKGYLEFEISKTDIMRHLEYEKGNLKNQEMTVSVDLRSSSRNGMVLFTKSNFIVKCEGTNGKWASSGIDESLEMYKSGRYYEGNTSSAQFKRMLSYCKNEWPKDDLVHMKIWGSGKANDGRVNTELWVIHKGTDGTCRNANVSVLEQPKTLEFSNFVPQINTSMSDNFCERIEEIRNVQ